MRSYKSPDQMLIEVAKKKPRLQALINQLDQLTLDDINVLSEPLWVRQALSTLKLSNGKGQDERVADIVNRAIAEEEAQKALPKQTYEVRLWESNNQFIGNEKFDGQSWKIEVSSGDTFMIVDDDYVRFGDSTLVVDAHSRYPLMLNSRFVGYMTLEMYKGFYRALLNQKHKI